MKVLVSTSRTQGQRRNDFCFVPEGELVIPGLECEGETVDGPCGCRRSLSGINCAKATTTFAVAERNLTLSELGRRINRRLVACGWNADEGLANEWAAYVANKAACYAVGTVLEKRGDQIQPRVE